MAGEIELVHYIYERMSECLAAYYQCINWFHQIYFHFFQLDFGHDLFQ